MTELMPFPSDEVSGQDLDAHFFGWKREFSEQIEHADPGDDLSVRRGLFISGDARRKRQWEKALARTPPLRYLYVRTRVSQSLFDQICRLKTLQRLSIDSTSISDCSGLRKLVGLTHLALGSSPNLRDLQPLGDLSGLKALDISGNWQHVRNLSPLGQLHRLQGLGLRGLESRVQTFESLEPIASLPELRYLLLTGVRVERGGLQPLSSLSNLEYLQLNSNELACWPAENFAGLWKHLTRLRHNLVELAATNSEFRAAHGIKS